MATFRMSNCDLVTFRMSNGNLQDDNLDHLLCCDFSHSLTNPMPATRKRYPLSVSATISNALGLDGHSLAQIPHPLQCL